MGGERKRGEVMEEGRGDGRGEVMGGRVKGRGCEK